MFKNLRAITSILTERCTRCAYAVVVVLSCALDPVRLRDSPDAATARVKHKLHDRAARRPVLLATHASPLSRAPMDENAERRIEERLTATFGSTAPPSAFDCDGLQTWGTFFPDALQQTPRPGSPYTSLFLQDTREAVPRNGEVGHRTADEGHEHDGRGGSEEATQERRGSPVHEESSRAVEQTSQQKAEKAVLQPEKAVLQPEKVVLQPEKDGMNSGEQPVRKRPRPGTDAEAEEGQGGEEEEDDDDDSGSESDSSGSDSEDSRDVSDAPSFRRRVDDNRAYQAKRLREEAAKPG